MLKLLITDATEGFCRALTQRLGKAYQIKTSTDGRKTLRLLRTFRPDILVLELQLSHLDGISVLRQAYIEGIRPRVLVIASVLSDYVVQSLQQLQVDYAMVKPCDMGTVAARIGELAELVKQMGSVRSSEERMLADMLMLLGVGASLSGHRYIHEAVLLQAKDPASMVTKDLYPAIVEKFGVSNTDNVERNIRVAIQTAWQDRDESIWSYYFSRSPDGEIPRPTNQEFICRMAQILNLRDT